MIPATLMVVLAFGGVIAAQKADERQGDFQLVQLQQQLEKLQNDLQNVRVGVAANRKPMMADTAQETVGEEISSLDRLPMPQRRGVGWQPLKRSHAESPSFQLGFSEPSSLRQQVLDAIEEHLLRDLESAREYGVEPQQILQDLRTKHQRDQE